jgi:hypothetical protein
MRAINSLVAVAVLTVACVVAPTVPATATPTTYVFSSDASLVIGGDTEVVTGGFTYDPATLTESNVSITLTGPFFAPVPAITFTQAYLYNTGGGIQASDCTAAYGNPCYIDWVVTFSFNNPLGTTKDPLSSAGLYFYNVDNFFPGLPVTGSAVTSESPIPEPPSMVLLCGGLAVLLFTCRLSQRARPA